MSLTMEQHINLLLGQLLAEPAILTAGIEKCANLASPGSGGRGVRYSWRCHLAIAKYGRFGQRLANDDVRGRGDSPEEAAEEALSFAGIFIKGVSR